MLMPVLLSSLCSRLLTNRLFTLEHMNVQAEKRQQALDEAASLQAAAVTAAVAESVVGSPRASGRVSGSATPSLPHTPTASTGGMTPRDVKVNRMRITAKLAMLTLCPASAGTCYVAC